MLYKYILGISTCRSTWIQLEYEDYADKDDITPDATDEQPDYPTEHVCPKKLL